MASIDETNKAVYTVLHADAALFALAPGDVWDSKVDDGTQLPYVVFQRVTGIRDYTFGGTVSSDKQPYMVKAYAEDTANKTGRELVAQIVDRLKTLLTNATLSIAGSTLLACLPTHDIPLMIETASAGRSKDTYSEGLYFDIFAS